MKSTDYGTTWFLKRSGLPERTTFYKVAIHPINKNILIAGLQTGLYKSTNNGETWLKIYPQDGTEKHCTDCTFSSDGSIIYAIGSSPDYGSSGIGYQITTNGGVTFSSPVIHTPQYQYGRSKISISGNTVYIIACVMSELNHRIFKSTDGGYNFSELLQTTGGGNSQYNLMLGADPVNPSYLYYGLSCMHRSTNEGESFCDIATYGYQSCEASFGNCTGTTQGFLHPDLHSIDFLPVENENYTNIIAVGCDGGIGLSTNGGFILE